MRRDLAPDELQRFLDEPLCATLATYRKDGSVLLVPVWQEWVDGGFNPIRHLGAEQGNAYADSIADDPMCLLRLEPGTMRTWDYTDVDELS